MSEHADRQKICASHSHLPGIGQGNPSRHFHERATLDVSNGLTYPTGSHVVEQDDIGFTRESLRHLAKLLRLDDHFQTVRSCGACLPAGLRDSNPFSVQEREMIVLDEEA